MAACFFGAANVLPTVDRMRHQLERLTIQGTEASPPEIVLLRHLLGGFKGLLVDAVWLRAVKLQQEEKYWELYQLYDWMGKLEPHMEEIWVFNGWNMSYNLVAELGESEGRWRWIERSIEWLRDQGLKYNPQSAQIMKQISWTYFHKIGRNLDLHHAYYKHRLASTMHMVMGPRELQDIPELAQAPATLAELLAEPEIAAMFSDFQLDPPDPQIKSLDTLPSPLLLYQSGELWNALQKRGTTEARRKVRHYISARILREKYKMTHMDIMVRMEEQFGEFDWRLPEPHAIYWAQLAAETDINPRSQIHYDRIILYSLQETMRRGQVAYIGPDPNVPLVTAFDLSKIDPLDRLYEMMMAKHLMLTGDEYDEGLRSIRDGHMLLLQDSAFQLYFAGYRDRALKMHRKLKELYNKPDPYMELDRYVLGQVNKLVVEYGTEAKVRGKLVDPLIFQTCYYICTNKLDDARKCQNLAARAWDNFVQWDVAQAQERIEAHRKLPPFKAVVRENVRMILLGYTGFPKELIPVLRINLGIADGWEEKGLELERPLVPPVPDASPAPD